MAVKNTTAATAAADNPLCARLQAKFSGRGAAAAGTRAAAEKVYRAAAEKPVAKAANPFEDTVEFVQAAPRKKTYAENSYAAPAANAYRAGQTGNYGKSREAFEKTAQFKTGAYAAAYARAAQIRSTAAAYNRSRPAVQSSAAVKKAPVSFFGRVKRIVFGEESDEIRVKSSPVSKGMIVVAAVVTLIIMLMLFSFSQINEFKNEISSLESQKAELCTKINDLNVMLDGKNDIRVIEDTATNQIGMVKSNQVESKYISVAGGERVELLDDGRNSDTGSAGVFGTLLSAIGSNWNRVMEYIH